MGGRAWIWACAVLGAGCSYGAGPTVTVPARGLAREGPRAGLKVAAALHTGSAGPFGQSEVDVSAGTTSGLALWRLGLLAGYAVQPLPHRSRVGFEGSGGASLGTTYSSGGQSAFSWMLATRLAVPIRMTRSVAPWEVSRLATSYFAVLPFIEFQASQLPSEDNLPRFLLQAGLLGRFHNWLPVLP